MSKVLEKYSSRSQLKKKYNVFIVIGIHLKCEIHFFCLIVGDGHARTLLESTQGSAQTEQRLWDFFSILGKGLHPKIS